MLNRIIESAFYDHLKKEYHITKYENYFSMREKMEMHIYKQDKNIIIESDYNQITIKQDNKIIAVVNYIFSNLISKYNNRRIPKKYNITYTC